MTAILLFFILQDTALRKFHNLPGWLPHDALRPNSSVLLSRYKLLQQPHSYYWCRVNKYVLGSPWTAWRSQQVSWKPVNLFKTWYRERQTDRQKEGGDLKSLPFPPLRKENRLKRSERKHSTGLTRIYCIPTQKDTESHIYLYFHISTVLQCSNFCVSHGTDFSVTCKVTAKVKFTLEQAMKAQRGSRGIALLFP
jgi:hypothetical protein